MTFNPIFALEVRARWRSNRSFLLLLGVALALALMVGFIYQRALTAPDNSSFAPVGGNAISDPTNGIARAGVIGRELFVALAHVNIIVWLLIAAASAATGIARERERGLLESLQLSRISACAQIGARWGANLMLLGALQLVLLPIYAVALLMGGVAPLEVGQAFYLVAWSAIIGTSLGLWFSARAHRPTNALFGALGAVALFSLGVGYFGSAPFAWWFWSFIFERVSLLHPNLIFLAFSTPNFAWIGEPNLVVASVSAVWLLLCLALVWSAGRNVNRTLPPALWQTNAVWVEKLRARQASAPSTTSKASQRASGALLTDLPLDRFVRFSDPLLAREVKARFRLRRAGFWIGLVRFALFLGAASLWLIQVFSLLDVGGRRQMASYSLNVLLFAGTLCLSVLAATSWTRERESGTWESLKLSLLTPRQILRAKWLSPLVSFAYYAAPLLILMPVGAFYVDTTSFVVGSAIVAVWLGLAVALGLWMSWRVRNGTAAIAWTVGVLASVLVGLPALNSLVSLDDSLAQWRYGVRGLRDQNLFYSFTGNVPNRELGEIYTANTGGRAPATPNAPEWMAFQNWGQQQMRNAEVFKTDLTRWNPIFTLSTLFVGDRPSYNSYGNRASSDSAANARAALWWSVAPPLLCMLALLTLLRYDVKREQLNA